MPLDSPSIHGTIARSCHSRVYKGVASSPTLGRTFSLLGQGNTGLDLPIATIHQKKTLKTGPSMVRLHLGRRRHGWLPPLPGSHQRIEALAAGQAGFRLCDDPVELIDPKRTSGGCVPSCRQDGPLMSFREGHGLNAGKGA